MGVLIIVLIDVVIIEWLCGKQKQTTVVNVYVDVLLTFP